MTDTFRQKLLNWFISMLLLFLATLVMLTVVWFIRAPLIEETPYMTRGSQVAAELGEITIIFALLFVPIIIWHLFDFAQRECERKSGRFTHIVTSHTLLVVTMGLSQIAGILIATGIADWSSCDDLPEMVYPFSCRIGLEWWANLLFFGPLLFSLILCIGKAAITIRSRLTSSN